MAEQLAHAPARFQANEKSRIEAIIRAWLEHEAQRLAFSVIGLEQEAELTMPGARFRLRIDRIDQDAGTGAKIVIDYKTGAVSVNRLVDERLIEPQLPMYALTDDQIHAVLYARVGDEEIRLDGWGADSLSAGRPPEGGWHALRSRWREQIAALCEEFRSGEATVAPYRPPQTCRYLPSSRPLPHQRLQGSAMTAQRQPADANARAEALSPERSCIVQAPAGSGKTTLLVSRFAALLVRVERPEQILAITFTRKAAAEMRQRVLALLDDEQGPNAAEIRARDEALGWHLAANPSRLQIQTIDSFAMSLTGRLPLASGFDRRTELVEDGSPLYEAAANQVLNRLFDDDPLSAEIARFLALNGNDAGKARRLLVEMLGRRDQWLDAVTAVAADRQAARSLLERSVQALVQAAINGMERAVPAKLRSELAWMVAFAAPQDDASATAFWAAAGALCLTKAGECRKRLTQREGFPPQCQDEKERALAAIDQLRQLGLAPRLATMTRLPDPAFTDAQIEDLLAVCIVLVLAVKDLSDGMRTERRTDFTELNLAARRALRASDGGPTELALALDYRIRHILIDEFQDTSIAQFELLELLVEGWSGAGDLSLFAGGRSHAVDLPLSGRGCEPLLPRRRRGHQRGGARGPAADGQLPLRSGAGGLVQRHLRTHHGQPERPTRRPGALRPIHRRSRGRGRRRSAVVCRTGPRDRGAHRPHPKAGQRRSRSLHRPAGAQPQPSWGDHRGAAPGQHRLAGHRH